MTIKELQDKRAGLVHDMRALINTASAAKRDLNASEQERYERMEAEVDSLDKQINREGRLSGVENRLRSMRDSGYHVSLPGNSAHGMDLTGYSITRALASAAAGRIDGKEGEISQELARRSGKTPTGFFMPLNALTSTGGTGGDEGGALFTPETGSFIDALRPRLQVAQLGATVLSGLTSDVKLPRQAAASTASWKSEVVELDEKSPTFDQVELSPHRCGAWTEFSKQLLIQSDGSVEKLVRSDLTAACAIALDYAAIAGTGLNNQPAGILAQSDLTKVALGAAGGAPTYAGVIALMTAIANANADAGAVNFLTNPSVRAKFMNTIFDSGSGQTLWDKVAGLGKWGISTNCPANLTKSTGENLSAIIAGDFAQVIIALFGNAADVIVDPFTKATEGKTRVVINMFADVAIRRAAYFAACVDAITT